MPHTPDHHTAMPVARVAMPDTRRTVLAVAEGCLMPQPGVSEDTSDSIICNSCDNLQDLASMPVCQGCDERCRDPVENGIFQASRKPTLVLLVLCGLMQCQLFTC